MYVWVVAGAGPEVRGDAASGRILVVKVGVEYTPWRGLGHAEVGRLGQPQPRGHRHEARVSCPRGCGVFVQGDIRT